MFAFLTGLIQLTNQYWSKILGSIYNKFVDVKKSDFDQIWKLYLIATISAALPIFFLWVAPNNQDIAQTQKVIKFMDEYEEAKHVKEKEGQDKKSLFESLKKGDKPKSQKGKRRRQEEDSDEEDAPYLFHEEIKLLPPRACRRLGIYDKIRNDYGIECDPAKQAQSGTRNGTT